MAGTATRLSESRLESLLESAKLLNSSLKLDDLLRHLLRTVMGRLLVSRCAIAIRSGDQMRVAMARGSSLLTPGTPFNSKVASEAGLQQFFDIGEADEPIGVLGVSRPARGELELEEQDFLRALLGLAASGINNAQAHSTLDQKVQELRALLDLVRGLASTLEPEEIAQLLVLTLAGRWTVRKYAIATWKEGHPAIHRQKGMELHVTPEFMEQVAKLPDAQIDPAAGTLTLPVRSGENTFGVVVCGPRMGNKPYNEADLEFGSGLVAQAAVAFENAWHFRETLGKKQLEKELALAAAIQQGLFPAELPQLAHSQLAARNRQARQVGGDYYDALPIDQAGPTSPHLLCVVDISGKGMFASLLMSNIQATLRALLSRDTKLPALAARTNDLMYAATPSNRYATALLAIYDPPSGACRWVNCGHNDGIVLRASGDAQMLETSGLALGMFPKRKYEDQEFVLNEGDILTLYSDGVTDAQDIKENEFGMGRLVDCLRDNRHRSAVEILTAVFNEIEAFVGEAPQFDDITLMVLKRRGVS